MIVSTCRGLLVGCLVALAACARTPDEQLLREAMDTMQQALEQARPADFMEHVAEDFTGAGGSIDRKGLRDLLRAQMLGNARIGITRGPADIEVHGDRATVRVTATFTGGDSRWLPERGSVYTLTSGWRRTGGKWHCYNAQWERVL
ncbi:nuclear transport factor 2 family protein [Dokdonella sp.]|uniref:nuclear transport factor 2 family protein n=1 Tax=Dokdonella sp. TaxID=2291710 RepID=UPI0025C1C910|nr:nuclear transport factor 2 family protein [Dokdonella sp.]MBX3693214.1 DUF4440 domain-containing protein [Dokdonella sp.]MCW5568487.1 DUF4440 domain-containing protein [Dokdonella sp.]